MTKLHKMQQQREMIKTIMKMMAEKGFTVGEAEELPEALSEELKRNSERFEKEKPFAIYESD